MNEQIQLNTNDHLSDIQVLRMTIYCALMAALIAAGAFIAIPIGPVPIVMQNFFVLLTGLLLGSRWGAATLGVYLLAGACGLPVFAGGLGGIGRLVGPTGGYLIGYLPAVFVIGALTQKQGTKLFIQVTALILGSLIVYACGVSWLKTLTGMTWGKTLAVGFYPFVIGDLFKIAAAIPVARALKPVISQNYAAHRRLGVSC
jgi:biotin transport system substrate-specific component